MLWHLIFSSPTLPRAPSLPPSLPLRFPASLERARQQLSTGKETPHGKRDNYRQQCVWFFFLLIFVWAAKEMWYFWKKKSVSLIDWGRMCLCQGLQFFYWINKSCIHNFVSHYFVFSCVMEIIIIKKKQKQEVVQALKASIGCKLTALVANHTATWKLKFPEKANVVILDMNWSIDWLSNSRFNCGASPKPPVANIVAVTAGGTCAVNVFARRTLTSHADLVRNPASVPACSYIYCTFPS